VPKLSFFGATPRGLIFAVSGNVPSRALCADDRVAAPAIDRKSTNAANKDHKEPHLAAIPRVSKLQRISI
jgi:hypothetical protein